MSVDTVAEDLTGADPKETYTFLLSTNDGKTFQPVATGLKWADVMVHFRRIETDEGGSHLACVVRNEGVKLVSRGGPKDGYVWFWKVER